MSGNVERRCEPGERRLSEVFEGASGAEIALELLHRHQERESDKPVAKPAASLVSGAGKTERRIEQPLSDDEVQHVVANDIPLG